MSFDIFSGQSSCIRHLMSFFFFCYASLKQDYDSSDNNFLHQLKPSFLSQGSRHISPRSPFSHCPLGRIPCTPVSPALSPNRSLWPAKVSHSYLQEPKRAAFITWSNTLICMEIFSGFAILLHHHSICRTSRPSRVSISSLLILKVLFLGLSAVVNTQDPARGSRSNNNVIL